LEENICWLVLHDRTEILNLN